MLSVRQLSRSFSEGGRVHRVLERADLEVRRGETVAVTGRSGSGKSTLLNLISGIDHADGGTVQIDGREVTAMGEPARTLFRRAHIGFVYQFFNLIPTLDVEENVRLVLRSEEHTSELQSRENLVCRLLLEKKKNDQIIKEHFYYFLIIL